MLSSVDSTQGVHKRPYRSPVITARKRSLRRLCFYTCLSFCSGGGERLYPSMQWVRQTPGRQTPQEETRKTPPWRNQEDPPQEDTPRKTDPPGRNQEDPPMKKPGRPPQEDTPRKTDLPQEDPPQSSACWEIRATSRRYASYWNVFLLQFSF